MTPIEKLVVKYRLLGLTTEIDTMCGNKACLIHVSDDDKILYIPDEVVGLNSIVNDDGVYLGKAFGNILRTHTYFTSNLMEMKIKNLKIVGGAGLRSADYMLYNCRIENIDLTEFDTSHLISMDHTFASISYGVQNSTGNGTTIKFGDFDTSKVTNMNSTFEYMRYNGELDLSFFKTHMVRTMRQTFKGFDGELNLSNFDTSNVKWMDGMFSNAKILNVDLSSFDTKNVASMESMFASSRCRNINLSSFKTPRTKWFMDMFNHAEDVEILDMSKMLISPDVANDDSNTEDMFKNSRIKELRTVDSFIYSKYLDGSTLKVNR